MNTLTTGVNTTWRGPYTSPPTACWATKGQLCYLCCCHCNGSESSVCRPHGLNCQPGQMMLCASMGVDVYNFSIHGWANNAYRTPSRLPLSVHHALPAQIPVPGCLPDRPHATEDNVSHLCPRESMVVAAPREKNSYHPQAPAREEEPERAFFVRKLPTSNQSSGLTLLQTWSPSSKLVVVLRDG